MIGYLLSKKGGYSALNAKEKSTEMGDHIHNPKKILSGVVEKGQTVLDIGCGPGLFPIAMAEMVGETGKAMAVDVQEEMLQIVREKGAQRGLESRIITHKSDPNRIGISEKVDFALAFYMVHEVPNAEALLKEIAAILKPEGKLLVVEPKFHVFSIRL